MSETKTNKSVDWELRLGLIFITPIIFALGGLYYVYKTYKEYWNA